ncbi:MAG TPA: cytochrome c oxidase subunit 3 [Kofleriaceae bacterium]
MSSQYDSIARQHATARVGMWLFLSSESLLFAGLIALFTAYRLSYPTAFHAAAEHANVVLGTINTYVLLTSSLTVALALASTERGRRRATVVWLLVSIALGATFDVLKIVEYAQHLHDGFAPGHYFTATTLPHGAVLYFTLYYLLTGLHALHVTAGIIVLAYLAVRARHGAFTPESHVVLECGALYWHLVDLVWIFLWPMLYLLR